MALSGDYGEPRPAIIIQSDVLTDTDSVLICQITSTVRGFSVYRLPIPANPATGLRKKSEIVVEKINAIRRDRCGPVIGRVDEATLMALGRKLAIVTGVADV